MEKNFAIVIGEIFIPTYLSYVNNYIEPMVTFTALVNINSMEYLLCFYAKVGLGKILTSEIKFSALQHKKCYSYVSSCG